MSFFNRKKTIAFKSKLEKIKDFFESDNRVSIPITEFQIALDYKTDGSQDSTIRRMIFNFNKAFSQEIGFTLHSKFGNIQKRPLK